MPLPLGPNCIVWKAVQGNLGHDCIGKVLYEEDNRKGYLAFAMSKKFFSLNKFLTSEIYNLVICSNVKDPKCKPFLVKLYPL